MHVIYYITCLLNVIFKLVAYRISYGDFVLFNVFCTNVYHSNLILRYLMKRKLNTDRMRDISNHDASCNAI